MGFSPDWERNLICCREKEDGKLSFPDLSKMRYLVFFAFEKMSYPWEGDVELRLLLSRQTLRLQETKMENRQPLIFILICQETGVSTPSHLLDGRATPVDENMNFPTGVPRNRFQLRKNVRSRI